VHAGSTAAAVQLVDFGADLWAMSHLNQTAGAQRETAHASSALNDDCDYLVQTRRWSFFALRALAVAGGGGAGGR